MKKMMKQQQQPRTQYRSFIFVLHETYGILLLHCTRKVKKGYHFQIPGGHVDEEDYNSTTPTTDHTPTTNHNNDDTTKNEMNQKFKNAVQMAGMVGAVRELYEETGIDLRTSVHSKMVPESQPPPPPSDWQIHPLQLYDPSEKNVTTVDDDNDSEKQQSQSQLPNEYRQRLFYTVVLTEDDFRTVIHPIKHNMVDDGTSRDPTTNNNDDTMNHTNTCCYHATHPPPPPHIQLRLSHEHSGYTFVKDIATIYSMIQLHSGGKIAEAFRMACTIKAAAKCRSKVDDDPWCRILSGCNTTTTVPTLFTHNSHWNNNADDDPDDNDDEKE